MQEDEYSYEVLYAEHLVDGKWKRFDGFNHAFVNGKVPIAFEMSIDLIQEAESLGLVQEDVLEINEYHGIIIPRTECLRADIKNMRIWFRHIDASEL